jgi:hypothetical protein
VSVRKVLPKLLLTAALTLGGVACGDRTVTSAPPSSSSSIDDAVDARAATNPSDAVAVADADLNEVDRLLREIEADLNGVDQDAAIPEGDPTQ